MDPLLFVLLFSPLQSPTAPVDPPLAVQGHPESEWAWRIVPYLFAANLDGTLEVGATELSTDVDFSDLVEDLDLGLFVLFEGRHEPWGFVVDASYIDLSEDGKGPAGVPRSADVTLAMVELAGLYRISQSTPVDLVLGVRYTDLDTEIQVGSVSSDSESELLDAFVGGRVLWPFTEHWRLGLYGDVGAGDSDLTWQAIANLGRDFGNWGLNFGYRILAYEVDDGPAELDIAEEGWLFGVEYRF